MQTNKNIVLSPLAKLDLENIWLYTFDTWSLNQANKYQNELFLGFTKIAANSEIGQSIDFIKKGYSRYKVNHHYVVYRIVKNNIDVVRVLHERMDTPTHL